MLLMSDYIRSGDRFDTVRLFVVQHGQLQEGRAMVGTVSPDVRFAATFVEKGVW